MRQTLTETCAAILTEKVRQRGRKSKHVSFERPWSHGMGSARTLITLLRP